MKYYTVRKGREPGIYTTWPECEKQVKGFSGAEYKSFSDKTSAENYLNNINTTNIENITHDTNNTINYPLAFIDGSFNKDTNTYGYGGFVSITRTESIKISGCGNNPEMASMRNVAGEILGAMAAIEIALEKNLTEIDIYYDYEGIAKWASGEWKRNNPYTANYHDFIKKHENEIKIKFIKVEAHTGIPGNELADKIAKRAVGLLPKENEI